MRESTSHRLAFNLYVELGSARSLEGLHATIASDPAAYGFSRTPSLRSIYRWSSDLHWQGRINDLEREARRRDAENHLQQLREMNERHARAGLALQQKAVQRIQSLYESDLTATEAIKALTEGARLERLARGEVTDRTSVERSDDIDLSSFSLAELRVLAEIAAANIRGDSAEESGQPAGLDGRPPTDPPSADAADAGPA
jgi:uncharacterized protein YoaH (UPF0181 family)